MKLFLGISLLAVVCFANIDRGDDYEILSNQHCGGESINSWNDGSEANYGTATELSECKQSCKDHSECAGFVQSETACGYWKMGPLNPYPFDKHTCYKKSDGNNMFFFISLCFSMVILL